jgi:hypothetical protein
VLPTTYEFSEFSTGSRKDGFSGNFPQAAVFNHRSHFFLGVNKRSVTMKQAHDKKDETMKKVLIGMKQTLGMLALLGLGASVAFPDNYTYTVIAMQRSIT